MLKMDTFLVSINGDVSYSVCNIFVFNLSILFFRLVPAKLMREWRALFETGIPLYEEKAIVEASDPTTEQVLEEERQQLLDEGDFMEYKVIVLQY